MTIFDRIRFRRIELGLSQEDLAKRLGLKSRAAISAVEKGKCDMTTDRISRYAEALETTSAFLMGWEEKDDPKVNEKRLLSSFKKLNASGQEEAIRRVDEMLEIKKYQK